jgi:hypothetical protein
MDLRPALALLLALIGLIAWPSRAEGPTSEAPQPWVEPMDCDSLAAIPPRGNIDYTLIQGIWNTHCTGCHTGTAPGAGIAGLSLHPDVSYERIVQVPSSQVPSLLRVFPGDPLRSWIFYKINCDVPGFGSRMPLGGRLNEIEQATIFDWIQNRAPREAIFVGRFEGRF